MVVASKNQIIAPGKQEAVTSFAQHVSSGKVAFFKNAGIDFVLGERQGPYLWDISGAKKLIDCHCNGGVFNLGHRHPEIIKALVEGLQDLDIGNHHLISWPRARLAAELAAHAPGNLTYTVFGVGGGEAIDLAIKVARAYTGRDKIISAIGGYHGHTGLALAAGDEKYRAPFGSMPPGFFQVPFNDIASLAKMMDENTAAVILETVPATYGIVVPTPSYLEQVRKICDHYDAVLIVDEIQAGLGRTGKLWAVAHYGVEPDILVTGKGLSGGIYPIAATCFKDKYESVFHQDPFIHISTFGGAEIGCIVALKVLELSSSEEFLNHVREIAALFSEGFSILQAKHPQLLVGLRQLGLMMGIEMVAPECGPLFTKAAYEHGILSVYANNDTRVAQLLPPLNIEQALAGEILERIDGALAQVASYLHR